MSLSGVLVTEQLRAHARAAGLSFREEEALALSAEGRSFRGIAQALRLPYRKAKDATLTAWEKIERLELRAGRALLRCARNAHGGRDVAPVLDENERPVALRARVVTEHELTQDVRAVLQSFD